MTVQPNDVVRATMEMDYEGLGAIQNVYHLRNVGGSATELQTIGDIINIMETLVALFEGLIAVLQVVNGVRMVNVTQQTDIGFGLFGDTTPFIGVGQVQPKQCCLGLNLFTDRLNVGGRKFFGAPVATTNTEGGNLSAAALADMADAGAHMIAQHVGGTTVWEYGVLATLDDAWLRFRSYSVPTTMITQRRRRTGQGI